MAHSGNRSVGYLVKDAFISVYGMATVLMAITSKPHCPTSIKTVNLFVAVNVISFSSISVVNVSRIIFEHLIS